MAYSPRNTNGQTTMANSSPVVLASDQTTIPVSLSADTDIIGKVGIDQTTPGTTNGVQVNAALPAGTNVIGQVYAATRTINGATTFTLISAATTNATSLKASAGTLYSLNAYNNGASAAYLKLFNLAVAPTVGTSVAAMTILLPAGGGSNIFVPAMGLAFGTGIAYAITGLGTTADTTAVAAAQVFVNGSYV